MTFSKFLVPVLALASFALPARAAVVTYCTGAGCSPNTSTVFLNDLTADDYTLQGVVTFSLANGTLSGPNNSTYTDTATGITFVDFFGFGLTLPGGGVLSTTVGHANDAILITLPATYLALELDVNVPTGLCTENSCRNQTTGFVGFINAGGTTSWSIDIDPQSASQFVALNSFNVATAAEDMADAPEISTLLMIGAGLISMRWMRRIPRRFLAAQQTAC